jgi:hypothetical protein
MNRLTLRRSAARGAYRTLEAALGLVFLGAVAHHVYWQDFKPLVALLLPILVIYYGFASLLYVRGRSIAAGAAQVRSLFAAEQSVQAAVWHLTGIIVGTSLYALFNRAGLGDLWLLAFLFPYALMQVGLLSFMRALWVLAPDFLRSMRAAELRRRLIAGRA